MITFFLINFLDIYDQLIFHTKRITLKMPNKMRKMRNFLYAIKKDELLLEIQAKSIENAKEEIRKIIPGEFEVWECNALSQHHNYIYSNN